MNVEAILNTTQTLPGTQPGRDKTRFSRRTNVIEFRVASHLQPGPITDSEVTRIRAAKGVSAPDTAAERMRERAAYQMVRDLLTYRSPGGERLSRAQIIQKCSPVKGLGQHNVNTICRALSYR